ncbi:MAG: DUF2851 family protein [Dehalococcoidia bacterium]|nr:DUF2851 family protein [Dehalococcoidia bacterium]
MKTSGRVPERLLSQLWKMRLWEGQWLAAADGRRIKLLWSGQPTQDGGPDFRNAIVDFGGVQVQGDVELDLEARLWRAHGHHRDPAFNKVVLHVVLWSGSALSTVLENGLAVPILSLNGYLPVPLQQLPAWTLHASPSCCPCREGVASPLTPPLARERLQAAGDCRFALKVSQFEQELKREAAEQVLYRGMMASLGYGKHKTPFTELAERLPLVSMKLRRSVDRQALLFGAAGLLPSQRGLPAGDVYAERIEACWGVSGSHRVISAAQWRFCHLRPVNFPLRRLAAMDCLLSRYRVGLLNGIVRRAREAFTAGKPRILEDGLLVAGTGYWARHFDFGRVQPAKSALLGRERAAVMVVNIILPFICAWGQASGEAALATHALDLYRRYPALPENFITRQMAGQLFPGSGAPWRNSARIQQGMIHLYQGFCSAGRGEECALLVNERPEPVLSDSEIGNGVEVPSGNDARLQTIGAAGGYHGGVVGA